MGYLRASNRKGRATRSEFWRVIPVAVAVAFAAISEAEKYAATRFVAVFFLPAALLMCLSGDPSETRYGPPRQAKI
ncbi:hypothetical protein [Pseudooceanicola sp.]|uniref:hypothetical protein n=1 Tax=Pseudooceanicola sp. TaxID=1914328 RepID=UPI0026368BF3|nr:hypothetical protein [Pseudooceanicola sp.]MDF1856898.1 hypothetical protein [Pseudooceanicola sp.]